MHMQTRNVSTEFPRFIIGLTAAAAAALGLGAAHAAQSGAALAAPLAASGAAVCSTAGVEGSYAYSQSPAFNSFQGPQGSVSAFAPVTLLGHYVFDGQGHVARSVSISLSGSPAFPVQDPGTYTVNPDCTGLVSFPDLGETLSFVIVSAHRIAIGTTTPGEVGVGTLLRQERSQCTLDSLRGNYVYIGNGGFTTFAPPSLPPNPPLLMDAFMPVSAVGLLSFDGRGGVKRNMVSVNFGGYSFPYADPGTYTVNGDCIASVYFDSDKELFSLLLVNSRTIFVEVSLPGAGPAGLATLVRQDLDD